MFAFNPGQRERLIQACRDRVGPDRSQSQVLVSVEEFFSGNADTGSIGCNLIPHPGIEAFVSVLAAIQKRPDVQDVLILISDLNDFWPFSDRVCMITSAPLQEVENWVQTLCPDEVLEVAADAISFGHTPNIKAGHKVYLALWD